MRMTKEQRIYQTAHKFFTENNYIEEIKKISKKESVSVRKILIELYPELPKIERNVIKSSAEKIAKKIKS